MVPHPMRGELWWVDFDPAVGGEIKKQRPAIIISNDAANANLNRVVVIPLTSSIKKIYPGECLVATPDKTSKAMADQLTTVSKKRLLHKFGDISDADLAAVTRMIKLHLAL